jgi:hypothetical protein
MGARRAPLAAKQKTGTIAAPVFFEKSARSG